MEQVSLDQAHTVERVTFYQVVTFSASGTPLGQLKFELLPPKLYDKLQVMADPELAAFDRLYRSCYFAVFGEFPDRSQLNSELKSAVAELAADCGCQLRLYLLAVMLSHREASPERRFVPPVLMGRGAPDKVKLYRDACAQKFGTFDVDSFETLISFDGRALERIMYQSELRLARYAVGMAESNVGSTASFYRDHEAEQHPYWCAIEPSYIKMVLIPHAENKLDPPSRATARHRHAVTLAHSALKRSPSNAATVFHTRSKLAPKVIEELLKGRTKFELCYSQPRVHDLEPFWRALGHALTHA